MRNLMFETDSENLFMVTELTLNKTWFNGRVYQNSKNLYEVVLEEWNVMLGESREIFVSEYSDIEKAICAARFLVCEQLEMSH